MSEIIKTETLCSKDGEPSIVIMKGHVTKEEFKQGFLNEGFDHNDNVGENIKHVFGGWFDEKFYHTDTLSPLLFEKYTIEDWD
jgi:hypothetical protein